MKRQSTLVIPVILLALALLPGCPEQEAAALWARIVIDPGTTCAAQAGATAQLQLGVLDLAVNREGYVAYIDLMNQLPPSIGVTGLAVDSAFIDTNSISLIGATVSYDYEGLSVELPQGFYQYAPTGVAPGQAGVGRVNLLPPAVLAVLRTEPWLVGSKAYQDPLLIAAMQTAPETVPSWVGVPLGGREVEIVARVAFDGVLHDGTTVISNELRFPIRVCVGCLVYPQTHPANVLLGGYLAPPEPCVAGQDTPMDAMGCLVENFFVEAKVDETLQQVAQDENFPPPSIPLCHPLLTEFIECYPKDGTYAERVTHLRYRWAFERVDAYCALLHEAPLWPAQP